MESFNTLNLPGAVGKALASMNFNQPTPIQSQAIPAAMTGRDLVGCAQTGTGKTAAFCIPILTRLIASPGKSALVLVPTRELALQVDAFWQKLTQYVPLMRSACVVGGMAMNPQSRALKAQPRMIIATPGRLIDHLGQRTARLNNVAVLVLDEADRMLDMGFEPQLTEILRHLPNVRQNLFFSATWAPEFDKLAKRYLREPTKVTVGTISQAAPKITQSVVMTTPQRKNDTLLDEVNRRAGSMLIFARTKSRTDRVARFLAEYGVAVNRIHGGRTQGQRNQALSSFKNGQIRVLVATDIAARGIDVTNIAHVVNYDLPQVSEDYVHRIGRTGRAGAEGQAVSLITSEDRQAWRDISKLLERSGSQVPKAENLPPSGAQSQAQQRPQPPRKQGYPRQHQQRPQPQQNQQRNQHPQQQTQGQGQRPSPSSGRARRNHRRRWASKR